MLVDQLLPGWIRVVVDLNSLSTELGFLLHFILKGWRQTLKILARLPGQCLLGQDTKRPESQDPQLLAQPKMPQASHPTWTPFPSLCVYEFCLDAWSRPLFVPQAPATPAGQQPLPRPGLVSGFQPCRCLLPSAPLSLPL